MTNTPLVASYKSPSDARSFSLDVPPLPQSGSVEEKTTYLAGLRANASKLQGEINTFLTQKMDEEKAFETGRPGAPKANEDREEDMYGEEDPEKDG